MGVRAARVEDVPAMAALAERKRTRYQRHAAPFQRPAANARAAHAAFLPKLLEWESFVVAVHEDGRGIDGFVVGRLGGAPPPFGEGSLFHVDDFAFAAPELWPTAGAALLRHVARQAADKGYERGVVVSGPASVDPAKTAFLHDRGARVAAEWWVKPLRPDPSAAVSEQVGFEAVVGPAPPVYDPGGPTCLALTLEDPGALPSFEEYASASQAVIAIVPTLVGDRLQAALPHAGYSLASQWFTAPVHVLTAE